MVPFQSSTLLIENYSQNQCQYCLKYDLIKTDGIFKNKKRLFPTYIESPIFTLTLITLNFECEKVQSI